VTEVKPFMLMVLS